MKEQVLEKIIKNIESLDDFKTKVEVLGNTFIRVGLAQMDIPQRESFTMKDVLDFVMNDVETNGENVANAMVRQGLLILTWLNKEKL